MQDQELNIIAKLEQAATGFANIAKVLGEYYTTLIKEGIPDDLARVLTRDAQQGVLNQRKPSED